MYYLDLFSFNYPYIIIIYVVVMGDRLNFIIDHRLELVEAFDAILPIIIGSHIFTELSAFNSSEGNSGASGYYLFVCV